MQSTHSENRFFGRLQVIQLILMLLFVATILKLAELQLIKHGFYVRAAENVRYQEKVVPAERGRILTWDEQLQDYYPLATNVSLFTLNAVPNQISNADLTLDKLQGYLPPETDLNDVREKLASGKLYMPPMAKKLSAETADAINALKLPGIYLTEEKYRYYPEGQLAANVLGFVNADRLGQYGMEGFLNKELKGKDGILEAERDAKGQPIALGRRESIGAIDGIDVVLTLDRAIQYTAEKELKKAVEVHGAEKGSVIIMDPKTGGILAMAQYPSYDPNNYSKGEISNFTNLNTQALYEPGSVFKAITMAIGIDLGVVAPDTTYNDTGELKFGDHTIRNSDKKGHGIQTMTQVLEKSLNTGVAFVANKVGKRKFVKYLEDLGFTQKSGIELEGEVTSSFKDVRNIQEIDLASMSFGQGIAVTPLELIRAMAAIANDGKMPEPHIVKEYLYPSGKVTVEPKYKQVLKPQTANLVGAMLVSVVERGHGTRAGVAGYRIAGKTGTAQIPGPGGYLPDSQTIGSFLGFGPVEDPQFVMLTRLDKPKGVAFAESTAAPFFGELADFLIQYLQIPPK